MPTTTTITPSPAFSPTIPTPFSTIANVPVSHVIPNLTAWAFPPVPINPSVQVSRPLPQSQPTPIAAPTASLSSTPLLTTVPVLPVTCGGAVYYLPPPVVATPAVASTSTVSKCECNAICAIFSIFRDPNHCTELHNPRRCTNTGFNEGRSPARVETVSIKQRPYSMA